MFFEKTLNLKKLINQDKFHLQKSVWFLESPTKVMDKLITQLFFVQSLRK